MNVEDNNSAQLLREREWQLQERAHRDERDHADAAGAPARLLRYRLQARGLMQPLEFELADGFAADSARHIIALADQRRVEARRFARRLQTVFALVYGGCAIGSVLVFGGDWLEAAARSGLLEVARNPWMPSLLVCLLASPLIHSLGRNRRSHQIPAD